MNKKNEKLNVRDFITIAIITVLEMVIFFCIGMPFGSTPIGWIFTLGIQSVPLGILFMLMYTKINKKGAVLVSGLLLASFQLMNFWVTALIMAIAVIIAEIIWSTCDRNKFTTMMACYIVTMTGWYLGAFLPLVFLKDMFLASLPSMQAFYGEVFNLVAGPLFFVALIETIIGCVVGAFLGKRVLKKHFKKAGVV